METYLKNGGIYMKEKDFVWHSKKPTTNSKRKQDKLSNEDDIPVYSFQESKKDEPQQKQSKKSIWKNPIFMATAAAIFLGLMIGAITLKFFSNVETTTFQTEHASTQVMQQKQTASKGKRKEFGLDMFALQAGVFKEQRNAKKWAKIYDKKQMKTFIWKRDGQYYLFTHMTTSKDKAKQIIDGIDEEKIDVFIKKWTIKPKGERLTDQEREWVYKFEKTWLHAMEQINHDKSMSVKSWENLQSSLPNDSKNLKDMAKEVSSVTKAIEDKNHKNLTIQLMELSATYEEL